MYINTQFKKINYKEYNSKRYFQKNFGLVIKTKKKLNFYLFKQIKKKIASTRHLLWLKYLFCRNKNKLKKYLYTTHFFGGRNKYGHRTMFRKGKHLIFKKILRILLTQCYSFENLITSIEFNSPKKIYIAQVFCLTKYFLYYLLISQHIFPGMLIFFTFSCKRINLFLNLRTYLYWLPIGTFIFNITSQLITFKYFFFQKSKYVLAPGTSAKILQQGFKFTKIKLPSGALYCLLNSNFATIGSLTNHLWSHKILGKAGRSCIFNKKSHVRGVAMNAVDHPHGGGRGKTKGCNLTPWGVITLNSSTRKKKQKKIWSFLILSAQLIKKQKKTHWAKKMKTQLKKKIKFLQRISI